MFQRKCLGIAAVDTTSDRRIDQLAGVARDEYQNTYSFELLFFLIRLVIHEPLTADRF